MLAFSPDFFSMWNSTVFMDQIHGIFWNPRILFPDYIATYFRYRRIQGILIESQWTPRSMEAVEEIYLSGFHWYVDCISGSLIRMWQVVVFSELLSHWTVTKSEPTPKRTRYLRLHFNKNDNLWRILDSHNWSVCDQNKSMDNLDLVMFK